jgi:polysaccharide biosynthesis protein PslG
MPSRRRGVRACGLSLVLVLLALGAMALPKPAAALPGPSSLTLGLADDQLFASGSAALAGPWLQRAQAIGSSFVRIGALWAEIAPFHLPPHFDASDPRAAGYNWQNLDAAIRLAESHGQQVVILVHDAPTWAEGAHIPVGVDAGTWYPSASRYAAFAHALATRYSGHFKVGSTTLPRVRYFQAWNEPNLPNYIMPQFLQTSGGAFIAESPIIYRSLLNAFYGAVKQVQPDSVVLSAGTAPYGDPPDQGQGRMYPVTFLDGLFCLSSALAPLPCPSPPHFDVLDHHPYSNTPLAGAKVPSNIGVPNLNRVYRILHAAERAGHVMPHGSKPLWITEIDWTAIPPTAPVLATQARNLALGMYVLWRQGISHVFWFQLRDPTGKLNTFADAGLFFGGGQAKPAAAAYHFPFATIRIRKKFLIMWGRAPAPGAVVIERNVGRTWKPVLHLRTTRGGIFYAQRRFNAKWLLRAREGGQVSPGFTIPN